MFYGISYIHIVIRRYLSNSGPVGFVTDVMMFSNADIINKSHPLAKNLQPLFLSGLDSWQTQYLPSQVSQWTDFSDGESSHFDIVSAERCTSYRFCLMGIHLFHVGLLDVWLLQFFTLPTCFCCYSPGVL